MRSFSQANRMRWSYINDPSPKKDPTTIFHSPYKGGRPNGRFINPTFLSSTLFYE